MLYNLGASDLNLLSMGWFLIVLRGVWLHWWMSKSHVFLAYGDACRILEASSIARLCVLATQPA